MTVYLLHIEHPSWKTALTAHATEADRYCAIRRAAASNYCNGLAAVASLPNDQLIEDLTALGYTITLATSELPDAPPVVVEDATREALAVIRLATAQVWGDLTISTLEAAERDTILCRALHHLQRNR